MKTQRLLQFLLILASGFFIQCTSDPIPGPPGADGADGINGIDGVDGVDGTTSCVSCHANSFREPIELAYAESGHGSGSSWARGTNGSCARCHNNEGFLDYLSGDFFDADGNQVADTLGYRFSNPINCNGCHDMHRSFDFETDGNDKAVRSIAAVNLYLDPNVSIDIRNSSDELGLSNLCVNCHQPRNSYDIPGPTEDYVLNTTRFGPHHGPQSTQLEGIMGALISGSEPYPGVGAAGHRQGSSCIACHMEPATADGAANHSWEPVKNICLNCHPNGAPSEADGYTTGMATLAGLLANVVGQEFERDTLGEPVYDVDGNLVLTGNTVTGIIVNNSSQRGLFSAEAAQAAWNYMTLYEDQSKGVHNPNYAKALLKNSIEALQN